MVSDNHLRVNRFYFQFVTDRLLKDVKTERQSKLAFHSGLNAWLNRLGILVILIPATEEIKSNTSCADLFPVSPEQITYGNSPGNDKFV